MRTGAPVAPAQAAAPCPAALLDDWVLPNDCVPMITHSPGGETVLLLLLLQHLANTCPHKGLTSFSPRKTRCSWHMLTLFKLCFTVNALNTPFRYFLHVLSLTCHSCHCRMPCLCKIQILLAILCVIVALPSFLSSLNLPPQCVIWGVRKGCEGKKEGGKKCKGRSEEHKSHQASYLSHHSCITAVQISLSWNPDCRGPTRRVD